MAVVAGEWPESRRDSDLGHGGRSGWHVRVALVAARLLEQVGGAGVPWNDGGGVP